jgi:hypothetical protein
MAKKTAAQRKQEAAEAAAKAAAQKAAEFQKRAEDTERVRRWQTPPLVGQYDTLQSPLTAAAMAAAREIPAGLTHKRFERAPCGAHALRNLCYRNAVLHMLLSSDRLMGIVLNRWLPNIRQALAPNAPNPVILQLQQLWTRYWRDVTEERLISNEVTEFWRVALRIKRPRRWLKDERKKMSRLRGDRLVNRLLRASPQEDAWGVSRMATRCYRRTPDYEHRVRC